jgi:hypothetical protein
VSHFLVLHARTHFRRYRGRPDPFSCFPFSDTFSAVPRASGPFFMLCTPGHIFDGTEGVGSLFMFCATVLIFGGTEGVGSLFYVLRSRTHFQRYRGRRFPFSCFALPDSFSAILWASGSVFMFCVPGIVFGGIEGVVSRFHIYRSQTCIVQYHGHRVPFLYFARPDTFSAVPWASVPIFMFCTLGLVFGGTEGVRSLCMFCATVLIFDGTEGVGSCNHVLCSQTHFRQYRGRRVPFSCISLLDSFSAGPSASGPVFMLCAHGLVFGGAECIGSRFLILRSQTHFPLYRRRLFPF